jgi:putative colanic acid biosynthesis UDP-glucose lipid carrier transferase
MNRVERHIFVPESVPAAGLSAQSFGERKWPIHYDSIEFITILADLVTIISAGILAGTTYHFYSFGTLGELDRYFGSAIVVSAIFVSLMKSRGMYEPKEMLAVRSQARTICIIWSSVFFLLAGAVFALRLGNELSRGANVLFAIFGLIALVVCRNFWRTLLTQGIARRRFSGRNVVLITDYLRAGKMAIPAILESHGFHLERHFTLPPAKQGSRRREEIISNAIAYIRGSNVEEIIVGADTNHWPELRSLIDKLRVLPFPVNFIPLGATSEIFERPSRQLGNATCIELQRGPLTSFDCFAKRCVDIACAGTALLALLPLLIIVAVAIKLDSPGVIFFRQRRCGFNGRCFKILKFRSMSVLDDGASIHQAQSTDERTTRLGKWLRRTSIDELPQLINVLEGSMSLVGPRPHAVAHDTQFDKLVRHYAKRHRVKPGLTGWAQVNGCRGPTPTLASIERRVELDLWYIDNWSLVLDFKIMLRTAFEVVRGRNAY